MKKTDRKVNKFLNGLILVALLAVTMCYAACSNNKINFMVEVTSKDGTTTTANIITDYSEGLTVYEALKDSDKVILGGEETDYGFYVTSVNGETADYSVDGSYWSFYINGSYAETGVSATAAEDGATYSFVYTVYSGN